MKIKYVSHACLYCESGADRVLMDPWFGAPAYLNQWHIHPQPEDDSKLSAATAILISHGHEDHLHAATLERCNKAATVYYPYQAYPGNRAFFRDELGFERFVEAIGNKTYRLPGGMRVTLYPVGHDCIFVLEDDAHVLVNVNDALHSCEVGLIEDVCATLRKRYPRIDYVFCGFGGASYFPNCFHHVSKDDFGVAVVREALFARNFCLVADRLRPRVAVPFAADFRLRHSSLQWINGARFGRARMPELFAALFPGSTARTTVLAIDPGQGFDADGAVFGEPEGRPDPDFAEMLPITRPFDDIVRDYAALIEANLPTYPLPRESLPYAIEVRAADRSAWIVVSDADGRPGVAVLESASPKPRVSAVIGADSVEHLLKFEWNSDIIVIGYGMEFWIDDSLPITDTPVHALGDVVTHYPKVKRTMFKTPVRFVRWAFNNHQVRHILRRKLGLPARAAPFADASLAEWLDDEPGTLARRLGIPEPFALPAT